MPIFLSHSQKLNKDIWVDLFNQNMTLHLVDIFLIVFVLLLVIALAWRVNSLKKENKKIQENFAKFLATLDEENRRLKEKLSKKKS